MAYKRFVEAGVKNPPLNPLRVADETGILGSPEFIRKCQEWLNPVNVPEPTLDDVLATVCAEFATTLAALATRGQHNHAARDAAVLLTRELLSESLETIAVRFGGVSRSAISEIAKRARERERTDATFCSKFEHPTPDLF